MKNTIEKVSTPAAQVDSSANSQVDPGADLSMTTLGILNQLISLHKNCAALIGKHQDKLSGSPTEKPEPVKQFAKEDILDPNDTDVDSDNEGLDGEDSYIDPEDIEDSEDEGNDISDEDAFTVKMRALKEFGGPGSGPQGGRKEPRDLRKEQSYSVEHNDAEVHSGSDHDDAHAAFKSEVAKAMNDTKAHRVALIYKNRAYQAAN